jgi:hypothetical protein
VGGFEHVTGCGAKVLEVLNVLGTAVLMVLALMVFAE